MTKGFKLESLTGPMGSVIVKLIREQLMQQRTLWAVTPKQQQEEILDYCAEEVDKVVIACARKIVAAGCPSVTATLQQITVKDGVKATLLFDRADEALDALTHRVGQNLVLVLVDPADHASRIEDLQGDEDQNPLPLGQGGVLDGSHLGLGNARAGEQPGGEPE